MPVRERCSRPARGSARAVGRVPRVPGHTPQRAVGRAGGRFGRGRARVQDGARPQQAFHRGRRVIRPVIGEGLGAEGGDLALDGVQVLDRDGDALERPGPAIALEVLGLGAVRLRERALEEGVGKGVERGLTCSTRAITACMSSTGESRRARKAASASPAVIMQSSSLPTILISSTAR